MSGAGSKEGMVWESWLEKKKDLFFPLSLRYYVFLKVDYTERKKQTNHTLARDFSFSL